MEKSKVNFKEKESYDNIVAEFENRSKYMNRSVDKGIVNAESKSSIGVRENGNMSMTASKYTQNKIDNFSETTLETSFQSNTITNRKNLIADEVLINKHKLNPQIYELSDFKQLNNSDVAIGNLTMMGTVLVKAWEPNLKKYVLIRRQVRIPIFSNKLNVPDVPKELNVDSDIANILKDLEKKAGDK